jgi:hypothetical protein
VSERVLDFFGSTGAPSPLWDTVDGGMIDVADLPLSGELRLALEAWAEERWDLEDDAAWIDDYVVRGRRLVELVQADLGRGWTVRWCDSLDASAEAPTEIAAQPPYVLADAIVTHEVRTVGFPHDERVWVGNEPAVVGDGEVYWIEGDDLVTEGGRRYPGRVTGELAHSDRPRPRQIPPAERP